MRQVPVLGFLPPSTGSLAGFCVLSHRHLFGPRATFPGVQVPLHCLNLGFSVSRPQRFTNARNHANRAGMLAPILWVRSRLSRIRTYNLLLPGQADYQFSYKPISPSFRGAIASWTLIGRIPVYCWPMPNRLRVAFGLVHADRVSKPVRVPKDALFVASCLHSSSRPQLHKSRVQVTFL